MKLAPEGAGIWGVCAAFGILLTASGFLFEIPFIWIGLGWLPFIVSAWFFRDPQRTPPDDSNIIVAPADGKIIFVGKPEEKYSAYGFDRKLSIFMSPLNVHVNRVPATGKVTDMKYNPGKCLTAFHEKASELNEQQFIAVDTSWGVVGFVQIAGWLARRIVCHLQIGQLVSTGERFGVIKFGSRLDVYLPPGTELVVNLNQRVHAGKTILGRFNEKN